MPFVDRMPRPLHRYRRARRNSGRARRTRATASAPQTPPHSHESHAVARRPLQSLRLAALVFIQYALLASDIRFVASANYAGVAVANVLIAINTWYLTRGIIEARTRTDRVCFVIGGTTGALLAVFVT